MDAGVAGSAWRETSSTERLKIKPPIYTLEEYLQLEETAVDQHEYYDGQIILKPMARAPHNEIAANLIAALYLTE
jgi:Uma2 family endonuclease